MTKIEVRKPELVWPGKYDEQGKRRRVVPVSLPFQTIETVRETRATREAAERKTGDIFAYYDAQEGESFAEGWKNKLIWGDNLLVMGSLLEKFRGRIDLIYIDPPFATGADFTVKNQIGENGVELTKKPSMIEKKAYEDTWGKNGKDLNIYLTMIYERLVLMRDLLSDKGSIYVHCDWRLSSHIRLALDDVFGQDNFCNCVTWRRQVARGMKVYAKYMPFSSDYLLLYRKDDHATWNAIEKENYLSFKEADAKYMKDDGGYFRTSDRGTYSDKSIINLHKQGRIYVTSGGRLVLENNKVSTTKGKIGIKYYREIIGDRVLEKTVADNIWDDIVGMGVTPHEYLGYPTQKPEKLLERVIKASSNEGDLVADFFCGSGTSCAVAEKLGRRWIGADLGRFAIHTTRKRLMGIQDCKPFELLNLGKYERQHWRGVRFNGGGKDPDNRQLMDYLVFILKAYGAEVFQVGEMLHGRKDQAAVHVGAVDAPITIHQAQGALRECGEHGFERLDILGWEFEMGMDDPIIQDAKAQGVKLRLLRIPREVMEIEVLDKHDVRFHELAYLTAALRKPEKDKAQITLENFVIPDLNRIPQELRESIRSWQDWIDYWAVDWNFQDDSFVNGWTAYRTRKDRSLTMESGVHRYETAGDYRILVKVIDIFGNDTSKLLHAKIR